MYNSPIVIPPLSQKSNCNKAQNWIDDTKLIILIICVLNLYANASDRVKQKINWVINYFNSYFYKYKEYGEFVIPYI